MEEARILSEIEKLRQKAQLNRRERRYLAILKSKLHPPSKSSVNWKGILRKTLLGIGGLLFIGGISWYIGTRSNLPPIDTAGHIEQNPKSHILSEPMPESIQKHMLEHADGKGKPGILIQYNCKKYDCEKNMVGKLQTLIKKYPENIYLAPGNYDGKIILTRLGKREVLDALVQKKIENIITQ